MPTTRYYALSIPGLEKVAYTEIKTRLKDVQLHEETRGRIVFFYPGDPRELLYLRTAEDVYVFIREIKGLTRSRNSLGHIFNIVGSTDFESPSRLHKHAHRAKGKKRLTFKVISSMLGRHNFRRVDVQKAVETAITGKYGWRLDLESPVLEIRIDLEEDKALLGLRLSDNTMSSRTYKMFHLPASLKPTVAYCMAMLSEPDPGDVFVDPMCGTGTIPIERAFAGPYKVVIAADFEESVVRSARGNINESHRVIDMAVWDVSAMPLRSHSVDKLVCNLPFGKKIGSKSANQILYSRFFSEMVRVLKPGGRAVLLTSENELMDELISLYPTLKLKRLLKIHLLGLRAYIYSIDFKVKYQY